MAFARFEYTKTFLLGPILDADGVAKTDEVVASIKVTKNGTVGAPAGASTLTHDHAGMYKYAANADDFNTLGEVTFSLNNGTNAMALKSFDVLPELMFLSLAGTGGNIPNVVAGETNGLFIAGTNAATVITGSLTTHFVGTIGTLTTYTGNTPQTADNNTILANETYGLAALKTLLDTTGIKLASDGADSLVLPADIITATSFKAEAVTKIRTD